MGPRFLSSDAGSSVARAGVCIGAIALVAYIVSNVARRIASETAPRAVSAATYLRGEEATCFSNPTRFAISILQPERSTSPQVHSLLAEQNRADGDEAAFTRIESQLEALLTDDNAANIIRSLSSEERNSRFGLSALRRWLKVDPEIAAEWVSQQSNPSAAQAFAVAECLSSNGELLARFCTRLPKTEWSDTLLGGAVQRLSSATPSLAIALADQISADAAHADALETVAYAWASREPREAIDWIAQVNDPSVRSRLICSAAKAYAIRDPLSAAEWVTAANPTDERFYSTLLSIVEIWADHSPQEAARFVVSLPDGGLREMSATYVAQRWLERDPLSFSIVSRNINPQNHE